MPYKPTDWRNKVYDSEGNVLQDGTPLHADNLNNMEQGIVDAHEKVDKIESEKGQSKGIATLDSNGIVHSSQLPSNLKEIKIAADIAERDSLETFEGLRVLVTDASDDPTVESGWAEYVWDGNEFIKTAEAESLDVVLKWGNITERPTEFPPTDHSHNESDITDLDKYSRQEVDNKLADKADKDELHSHGNKATLDKLTEGHLNKIVRNEQRIESLEEDSSKLHSHANKSTLDRLRYSGSRSTIDLIEIEEQASRKYSYDEILNTPYIPKKTSDLTNDSNFPVSNASRIHVSYSDDDIPQLKENDIVIKVI